MDSLPPHNTREMPAGPSEPKDSTPVPESSIPRLPSDSNNELLTRYNTLDFKRSHLDADKIFNNDDSDVITNKNVPNKVEVKDKDVGNKFGGKAKTKLPAVNDHFDEFDDIISNIDSEISTLQRGLVIENKGPAKRDSLSKRGPPPPLPPKPKLGLGSTLSRNLDNDVIANPSVTIASDL